MCRQRDVEVSAHIGIIAALELLVAESQDVLQAASAPEPLRVEPAMVCVQVEEYPYGGPGAERQRFARFLNRETKQGVTPTPLRAKEVRTTPSINERVAS